MQMWVQIALLVCAVVVAVALVPTLVAARRAAERAERVLGIAERELQPLATQLRELLEEARALSRQGREELARVGELTDRAESVAAGMSRVLSALVGLTRVGQFIGVAAGIKSGLDVFLQRLKKQEGDHDE